MELEEQSAVVDRDQLREVRLDDDALMRKILAARRHVGRGDRPN